MEGELQKPKKGSLYSISILLELSASNDLIGFKRIVEEEGSDVDEVSFWYGKAVGLKKMGIEERTPLMIAALFGSTEVLKYILATGQVDVNRASGSDGATALHCAAAGGSAASLEILRLLLDASADANCLDANGNRPGDVIAPILKSSCNSRKKRVEMYDCCSIIGEGCVSSQSEDLQQQMKTPQVLKDFTEKEYPIDLLLPDINNEIYGTDEFRMYTFKVKPCSRAYSHDWTECPFVHPGENARRRDPRKFHYSCVPCPEFRKGTCRHGDACEYAHGVFECWLHPAQYRTRLCKDETGCTRRVCFFAHKPEELRPLYASTGSAVPSPRSSSTNVLSPDMSAMSPLALGSPSALMLPSSTPTMSPSGATSSPMGGLVWQNQSSLIPPTLQLPSSRLKTALRARDIDLEMDVPWLNGHHQQLQYQQQLVDRISSFSPKSSWTNTSATGAALATFSGGQIGEYNRLGGLNRTILDDEFGTLEPSVLSQLQSFYLKTIASQLQSPTGIQIRQNTNQQLQGSSYPSNMSSSPVTTLPSFGLDPFGSTAEAVMNTRSLAFAKRSQSFIERGAVTHQSGFTTSVSSPTVTPSTLSDWGSPNGKLDWGIRGEELNKLKKSASFGFRSSNIGSSAGPSAVSMDRMVAERDGYWVQSPVKDVPPVETD